MAFQFSQGLFQFEFTDHFAILGVSIDAEFNEIRKRYIKIARHLHPDTCPLENPEDKELAKDILSKLVTPAYNKFEKESERQEYYVVLNKITQNISLLKNQLPVTTEAAKQVASNPDFLKIYQNSLGALAEKQYFDIQASLATIEEISQLNLAYLSRKDSKAPSVIASNTNNLPKATTSANNAGQTADPPPKMKARVSLAEQSCQRAEKLIVTHNITQAVSELREALKLEPNNCKVHALLGICYLQQNQMTMAKLEIQKAIALNPQEPKAIEAQQLFEKANTPAGTATAKAKTVTNKNTPAGGKSGSGKKDNKSEKGGGFFGGLFGGGDKKK
ncbi:MAG: J domain-containing protein [Microcoleaceae cyanobacterium]